MASSKKIQLEELSNTLAKFQKAEEFVVPERGWINTLRNTLRISEEQFSEKLKLNRGGVFSLERSEKDGTISIETLSEVANALDMKLMYAIVPKSGTLSNFIMHKARRIAEDIILKADPSIDKNRDGDYPEDVVESIESLATDIKRELRKALWE